MPRIKRQFKEIHRRSDKSGNMLIITQEPVYGNKKIFIHLITEAMPRFIGEVDKQNGILLIRRKRDRHLHREMNAYGFNFILIRDAKLFTQVLLEEEVTTNFHQRYLIPTKDIMNYSTVKYFKEEGLEMQYFMKLEQLSRYITKKKFKQSKLLEQPKRAENKINYGEEFEQTPATKTAEA